MPEPAPAIVLVYLCGHLADALTGQALGYLTDPTTGRRRLHPILGPCRACGPQRVEKLKDGRKPYHELP